MIECIQGESGVWPCSLEYLKAAREMTSERDMLLIVDEVQTGFCRTGSYFAFQSYGIEPDIVTMAKGIADGVPMGAFAAKTELASLMQPGMHGTTFGGGPLACAAAAARASSASFFSCVRRLLSAAICERSPSKTEGLEGLGSSTTSSTSCWLAALASASAASRLFCSF